jgi:SAM-dependent methyltransferase
MAHPAQVDYCNSIKSKFPKYFKNTKVVDFGSLDINGSNREFFEDCDYTGIDIGPGKNVDIVCVAHEYAAPDNTYDVVISTEMFEHDRFLYLSLPNMIRVLRPGGLFLFTCAGPGRGEHGTRRSEPHNSPLTIGMMGDWPDYYENVDENKIRSILNIESLFSGFSFNIHACDFRGFGIKK